MDGILNAVITALNDSGIPALRRFPAGVMPRRKEPAVAVSFEKIHAAAGGFREYLGMEDVPGKGTVERYGKKMCATVLLRVCCPKGQDEPPVTDVLLGLQGGVRISELSAEEPVFDPVADCFVTKIRAEISAYLMAERIPGDDPGYRDFRLEGDMK